MNMMGAGGGAVAGPMVAYLLRPRTTTGTCPCTSPPRLLRGHGLLDLDRSQTPIVKRQAEGQGAALAS